MHPPYFQIQFDIALLAWQANIDVQPVFDYYKAVTYMCSYLMRQKHEYSEAMKQSFKESWEKGAGFYEQMKYVQSASLLFSRSNISNNARTLAKNVFSGVLNVNSNIPEKRVRMMLNKKEIAVT